PHLLHRRTSTLPFLPSLFLSHAPPTTDIYTLSLHDALPISMKSPTYTGARNSISLYPKNKLISPSTYTISSVPTSPHWSTILAPDRKSTRLNSSHVSISYAVFCLKKKNYNAPRDGIETESES